ncbi:purine nucleoside phosphorylase [Dendroctonus ponderosae]|nr:purine nucleoside phosphorylase [Dendroctonus ponderosae]
MSALPADEFNRGFIEESARFIRSRVPVAPKLLIICGSGLGGLADTLEKPVTLSYDEIPNFPQSTVPGHAGELIFGTLANVPVACMKGRFHYYEGYSLQKVTTPIRIMQLLGIKGLIVTNAAGSVNKAYQVGDIMLIKDHLNFFAFGGRHPLRGPNDPQFGARFFPMNRAYDRALLQVGKRAAAEVGLANHCHEGVYGIYSGPNYETVAEIKYLQLVGVDAIGMSTVPEVLVAKHCGLRVFGFSFITNKCVDSYEEAEEPNHAHILDVVQAKAEKLKNLVIKFVEHTSAQWL